MNTFLSCANRIRIGFKVFAVSISWCVFLGTPTSAFAAQKIMCLHGQDYNKGVLSRIFTDSRSIDVINREWAVWFQKNHADLASNFDPQNDCAYESYFVQRYEKPTLEATVEFLSHEWGTYPTLDWPPKTKAIEASTTASAEAPKAGSGFRFEKAVTQCVHFVNSANSQSIVNTCDTAITVEFLTKSQGGSSAWTGNTFDVVANGKTDVRIFGVDTVPGTPSVAACRKGASIMAVGGTGPWKAPGKFSCRRPINESQ